MKQIDRLYIQVKRAYGEREKQVSIAFIDLMEEGEHKGKIRARADLWDGVTGSQKPEDSYYSYHDTEEEALNAIKAMAEAHAPIGNRKTLIEDIPIVVMCWGQLEKYAS